MSGLCSPFHLEPVLGAFASTSPSAGARLSAGPGLTELLPPSFPQDSSLLQTPFCYIWLRKGGVYEHEDKVG